MRLRLYATGFVLVLVFALVASATAKKPPAAHSVRKRATKPAVSPVISRDPYIGAIVVDSATGRVILDDEADAKGYPASVIKLMDLLLVLEKARQGTIKLTDKVKVTAESVNIGGSQAYLKKDESFTVDDLLYALMVKSANDAAVALAIHVAGSKESFVQLMNGKAQELGMTSTRFVSVNGLPPRRGQTPDVSTARDLTLLARAVLKYPDTLRYTSAKSCTFRNGSFAMSNHNHLLGVVEGCDGLKTGYFSNAGFSIVATAQRNNSRIIAVVLGSRHRRTRDLKARGLLAQGFQELPRPPVQISGAMISR